MQPMDEMIKDWGIRKEPDEIVKLARTLHRQGTYVARRYKNSFSQNYAVECKRDAKDLVSFARHLRDMK